MTESEGATEMSARKRQEVATRDEAQHVPAMPQTETGAVLSLIERAAKDPTIDMDKMERLMRMRNDMIERQQEQAFFEAMGRAQAELPQVLRDAENSHTRSRYARLETIAKAITPVITRHGFTLSFGTEDSPKAGHYRVTCTLGHASGYSRDYHADLPADVEGAKGNANKTAIQGFGSTVSYGRRYLTLLIFNVALTNDEDDDDGNGGGHQAISEEQVDELMGLVARAGADLAKFCKYMKVESIAAIPASKFDAAVAALKAKEAKR